MTDYDRRVKSQNHEFSTAEVEIHGNVEVSKGDLIFLDRVDGLRDQGSSELTNYGFPFSYVSGSTNTLLSNSSLAKDNFLGVAGWHSDSGVTERITVYTSGLFKYPLKNSRVAKLMYMVTPTGLGSGTVLSDQQITVESSSTSNIGILADYGSFKGSVKFVLKTIIHPFSSTFY